MIPNEALMIRFCSEFSVYMRLVFLRERSLALHSSYFSTACTPFSNNVETFTTRIIKYINTKVGDPKQGSNQKVLQRVFKINQCTVYKVCVPQGVLFAPSLFSFWRLPGHIYSSHYTKYVNNQGCTETFSQTDASMST